MAATDDERASSEVAFDEAFVAAAFRTERAADQRVADARRIARDHAGAGVWRGPTRTTSPAAGRRDARGRPSRRSRRGRRDRAFDRRGLLAAVLAAGLVLVLGGGLRQLGLDRGSAGAAASAVPGRPADAADRPLAVPPPAPAGVGGHRFLRELPAAGPVAFDPCRPVHYAVRRAGQPEFGEAVLAEGLRQLTSATGLQFVRDPDTTEAPGGNRPTTRSDEAGLRWAPVLVAWSHQGETTQLAGRVAGLAGPVGVAEDGPSSQRWVTGEVVLDAPDLTSIWSRPGGPAAVQAVVLHELGHLVGLDHVDDPTQVMHGDGAIPAVYGAGDLRGLSQLGRGACHP